MIATHKPHSNILETLLEKQSFEKALLEFDLAKAHCEGSLEEYKGATYIEDSSVIGNPEKIVFYIKDFVSHMAKA